MERKIVLLASFIGGLGVVLGAFAAHGLKPLLSVSAFESFNTGIRYQMYHAFLLFFLAITTHITSKQKSILYTLILIGVLVFSGSIYVLATNDLTSFNFKVIGFITPIGGLFLIASWVLLFVYFFRKKK
ncbi:DUF423 domain-containing protein [Flavobacteriaceae bacterium]|jgi:uncharacterized membrane protein YgdD (TMEM256/DUF423 family)|nr:DUF423 domain-containing protein [Flavobacteriaceae bacterium]MDC1472119.1 DUF423 domain-containing protein [Flavobacteriaceae bacterium]MDC1539774.1 DUF423 domain-containing protein [Flavobacteriaceae bacterium]